MEKVPNSHRWNASYPKHVSHQREISKQPEVFSLRLDGAQKLGWQHSSRFAHDWIKVAKLILGVNWLHLNLCEAL